MIVEASSAKKLKSGRPLRVKLGLDPTRPTCISGHGRDQQAAPVQDLGHHVQFLIGFHGRSVTERQNATRPPLSREQILQNAKTYQDQVFRILDANKTEVCSIPGGLTSWEQPV